MKSDAPKKPAAKGGKSVTELFGKYDHMKPDRPVTVEEMDEAIAQAVRERYLRSCAPDKGQL